MFDDGESYVVFYVWFGCWLLGIIVIMLIFISYCGWLSVEMMSFVEIG